MTTGMDEITITRLRYDVSLSPSSIHGGLGIRRWHDRWQLCAFSDGLRRPDFAVFPIAESSSRKALEAEMYELERREPYGELRDNRKRFEERHAKAIEAVEQDRVDALARLGGSSVESAVDDAQDVAKRGRGRPKGAKDKRPRRKPSDHPDEFMRDARELLADRTGFEDDD